MTKNLNPTSRDLWRWRRLCREALRCAQKPHTSAGDLKREARAASKAVAPTMEALTEFGSPLIRLSERFAALSGAERDKVADELARLARGMLAAVGGKEAAQARAAAGPPPELPFRADIGG